MSLENRRVVHITSAHPPFDSRIFVKQCRSLSRAGFDVTLIAPHGGDAQVDGVRILGIRKAATRLRRIFGAGRRAIMLAARQDADLYHLHDPELLLWAPLLRLKRVPIIFDMHENIVVGLAEKPYLGARSHRLLTAIAPLVLRILLARVPVVFAEDSYAEHYPWIRQSTAIRNFAITAPLAAVRPPKHAMPTVTYLGAVSPERGIEVTLHALNILHRRGMRVNFECVGPFDSDAEQARIEDLAKELELPATRFHGYQQFDDAVDLVARCHVGLAILASLPNLRESYPTKIFDYVALGLPVVASDFRLYRNLIEDLRCGIVVDPTQPDLIADAIEDALSSFSPENLRDSTTRLSERYDWDRSEAPRLIDFYRTAMRLQPSEVGENT